MADAARAVPSRSEACPVTQSAAAAVGKDVVSHRTFLALEGPSEARSAFQGSRTLIAATLWRSSPKSSGSQSCGDPPDSMTRTCVGPSSVTSSSPSQPVTTAARRTCACRERTWPAELRLVSLGTPIS